MLRKGRAEAGDGLGRDDLEAGMEVVEAEHQVAVASAGHVARSETGEGRQPMQPLVIVGGLGPQDVPDTAGDRCEIVDR
jgi:hypothetical protein